MKTLALFIIIMARCSFAASIPVGPLGDLAQLNITGARAFTVEQVRAGLLADMEVQIAATPSAPRDAFLATVTRQATVGYLTAGFPNAKVKASVDGEALVVTVEEGKQYLAGGIEVSGTKKADATQILAYIKSLETKSMQSARVSPLDGAILIKTNDKPSDPIAPVWEEGKPATFNPVDDRRIIAWARQALCQQGYFWAKVSIDRRLEGNKATLLIQVVDEGARATLADVEVIGARRNTLADVKAYLKLEAGQSIDLPMMLGLHRQLWLSGRFFGHDLLARPAGDGPGRVKLHIKLDEHPKAPLLKEELPGEALAVLRCREWLTKTLDGENDLVVSGGSELYHLKLIINTRGGIVIAVAPPDKPGAMTLIRSDFTVVITQKVLGAYSVGQKKKFVTSGGGWGLEANVDYIAQPDSPDDKKLSLLMNAGVSTRIDQPFHLKATLAPVCFMDLVYPYRGGDGAIKPELKDGVFSVAMGAVTFRFREQSGELVEMLWKGDSATMRMTVEPGALARENERLEKSVTTKNLFDADKPLSSAVTFAADLLFSSPWLFGNASEKQRSLAARAVSKLVSDKAILEAEQSFSALSKPQRWEGFHIPFNAEPFAQPTSPFAFLRALVPYCDDLFPRQTWPWTMSRETILLISGWAKYTDLEARRTFNDPEVGPVGFFVGAKLYAMASDPASSRIFAKRGLERLTLEFFEKDCRTLFDGKSVQARLLSGVLRSLKDLTDEELDALAAVLPQQGSTLRTVARLQREFGEHENVLPPGLAKALWEQGIKDALDGALKDLATKR